MNNNKTKNKTKRNIIRLKLKNTYQPLIEKALKPLQYISNRSTRIASINILPSKQKFKKLYSLICKKEFLIQALGNISPNKGASTPGTDKITLDGTTLKKIELLANSLKKGTFKFSPYRRTMIEKPTKKGQPIKLRPLGIPNFFDRVVQEAIRIILEAIYEPIFEKYNLNYGFRKNKSCQMAIEKIQKQGTACVYAIEGDIKGAFDNVDPKILLKFLENKIGDTKLLNLIKQGFHCGLLDHGVYKDTLLGVPQGGIASPILFNIYMHEFDMFIQNNLSNIIEQKNIIENRKTEGATNRYYLNIQQRINRTNKSLHKIFPEGTDFNSLSLSKRTLIKQYHKKLRAEYLLRSKTLSVNPFQRSIRILYVRYADDFIILTNANKKYCEILKKEISNWITNNLNLELSTEKTKITSLKNSHANFLGYSIKTYRAIKVEKKAGKLNRVAGYGILIGIDMERMLNRLVIKGFCKDNSTKRPIAKPSYTVLPYQKIIETYNYIIRGIGNYYLPVISRKKEIIRIIYILEYSAYMTIAKKMSTKISKIREKFGKPLTMNITQKETYGPKKEIRTVSKTVTLFDYLTLKTTIEQQSFKKNYEFRATSDIFNPMNKINWRTYRNLDSACCICGSTENVELHHVRAIRKEKVEGFTQVMKQLNRKTIPLCKEHHIAVERGLIKDIKINDLYFLEEYLA